MNTNTNTIPMTPLQLSAWQRPFLNGDRLNLPPRVENPRRDWRVALSINL